MAPVPDEDILPSAYARYAPMEPPEWILGYRVAPEILADPEAHALIYRLAKIAIASSSSDFNPGCDTCFAPSSTGEEGIDEHDDAYHGFDFYVALHWFAHDWYDWSDTASPLYKLYANSPYKPAWTETGPQRNYEYDPPPEGADDVDPRLEAECGGAPLPPECDECDEYDGTVRDLYLNFVYYIFGHWSRRNVDQDDWLARNANWGLGDQNYVTHVD